MKMIKYSMFFLFIIIPFFFIGFTQDRLAYEGKRIKSQYEKYLNTAIEDASVALLYYSDYEKSKDLQEVDSHLEEVIDTFYTSLFFQMGIKDYDQGESHYRQALVKSYIPVLMIIDYDGFYIYTMTEYTGEDGYIYMKPMLLPKRYFTMLKDDLVIHLHLDHYVKIYNPKTKEQVEGTYEILSKEYPLLNDLDFDNIKKQYIINLIEENLNYYIQAHNQYAKQYGIVYDFYLPRLTQQEWENCISDIGVMAFLQGIPYYKDTYINLYGYQGSRILKRTFYYAYTKEGFKFYCREKCLEYKEYAIDKVYDSKKEAAKDGYYPCVECQ
jgi:hypothetical protein